MKNIDIKYTGKGKSKKAIIQINNECSVHNIENLYNKLKIEVEKTNFSEIELQNISNIDLAGIQFLLVLKRKISERNPEIKIRMNLNEEMNLLINRSGLNNILNN